MIQHFDTSVRMRLIWQSGLITYDLVNQLIWQHQYFSIGYKSFIWEYYTTHWTFNNTLAQKRRPFRPVSHETWIRDCHKYCLNKILILCTFYEPIFEITLWTCMAKKSLALPKHWQNPLISWHFWALQMQTLHATIRGNNWQRSNPTAYRHRQNDSTLAQWCWRIQWGQQSCPYHSWSQPCSNVAAVHALIGAPAAGGALGDRL